MIHPIHAITYDYPPEVDMLPVIAPPYDVLDERSKAELLSVNDCNIVAIDLPHLPAKTVGPDEVYQRAGEKYRRWQADGTLKPRKQPAMFAYRQSYSHGGQKFRRMGLFCNVRVQPFGKSATPGMGGIHPHEQTFSGPKEDRLKLMRATKAQLSPIFGLHSDPTGRVTELLDDACSRGPCTFYGTTSNDNVLHEVWAIESAAEMKHFQDLLNPRDIFIADGHHRYNTAMNYRHELIKKHGPLPANHPANFCTFVLVAMQDPGMIVLPTHRVLGSMRGFSLAAMAKAGAGQIRIAPFAGKNLAALEAALPRLPGGGPHAMGLYDPSQPEAPLSILTTVDGDPLKATHGGQSLPWRQLDVAIVQHLLVERILEPAFRDTASGDGKVTWKFPHTLHEVQAITGPQGYQLAVIVQPTPLESVRLVSEAGELMPQKSTFFYPKLATGLIVNPLE